jgi:hypothetical protein
MRKNQGVILQEIMPKLSKTLCTHRLSSSLAELLALQAVNRTSGTAFCLLPANGS